MLTPLFCRRLLFLLGWMAFGAGLALHTWVALLFVLLSLVCTVAEQYLAKVYSTAAEPLIPDFRLRARLQAGRQRLGQWYLALTKGNKLLVLALVALAVFFFGAPLLRLLPEMGGFTPDTLNAYTLGGTQYFLALTMAYVSWRWLFPGLYTYAVETMEGKLLESIVSDLLALFPTDRTSTWPDLDLIAERRRIATLQFTIRCVRFVFSISPFVFFFLGANAALTAALTAVPAGA